MEGSLPDSPFSPLSMELEGKGGGKVTSTLSRRGEARCTAWEGCVCKELRSSGREMEEEEGKNSPDWCPAVLGRLPWGQGGPGTTWPSDCFLGFIIVIQEY